ncbi:MAG: MFS transporter [Butyrivibrio sp.]|nr:MFS transporter [Butyrivibrio sp.]
MADLKKRDFLWIILFLVVFINGFEAGGYQASLWNIGETYDLSLTSMGLFASVELFATMLAPLVLGSWADHNNKAKCIIILLAIQLGAALFVLTTVRNTYFIGGIFFLGLTTSALQFISIAALADAYPVTNKNKIGFMTSMYAAGALVAPLGVNFYLRMGLSWRILFALLSIGSAVALIGIVKSGSECREELPMDDVDSVSSGKFVITAILCLCVVMCIYVGFENGFTFFVDTMFTDTLKSENGKFALSLFWAVMIPSRMLVGHFSKHSKQILLVSLLAIPAFTVLFSSMQNSTAAMLVCIPLGMASGAIYPCVLTIMLNFSGKRTATSTGMITTATGIGGVVFTALTGYMSDLYGMRSAIAVLGSFFILSLLSLLGIHLLMKKHSHS